MTNTTLKDLFNIAPHAGRVAHTLYGIDFLKPYHIARIDGNFTTKKVLNLVNHAGINAYKAQIIVFMTDSKGYRASWIHLVRITASGDFEIEPAKKLWTAGNHDNITTYYRKADFNDDRKSETATAYIIAQENEYTTPDKPATVDRTARFKYISNETHTAKDGTKYITRVRTIRTDDTGTGYTINDHGNYVYTSQLEKYRELSELIDKSGYITQDKRDSLKRQAMQIKADRQKAEYIQTDHTAEVKAITAEVEALRDKLADELKQAKTYDEIRTASKKIDAWRGLTGIYCDLDLLQKRTAGNEYTSNDSFNKALANIRANIATLQEG